MSHQYSRRSFLTGVAVTGIGSAWAGKLLGSTWGDPPLTVAWGEDPSGARDLLIDMWNARNTAYPARVEKVVGTPPVQLEGLRQHAENGTADVIALDVIHLAEFASAQASEDGPLITPIVAERPHGFIGSVRDINRLYEDRDDFWALPFNTDCGVMFHRIPAGRDPEPLDLTALLAARTTPDPTWISQLPSTAQNSGEAFLCNVFEHALVVVPDVLGPRGTPSTSTEAWAEALMPLREAIARRSALGANDMSNEAATTAAFNAGLSERMRNWPNQYRLADEHRFRQHGTYQVRVTGLPVGVLGGQSLAVVARGSHRGKAAELANFLCGLPAQRVLASFGFAPVRGEIYTDGELQRAFPHLPQLSDLVAQAVPRPVHPRYTEVGPALQKAFRSFLFGPEPMFGPGFATELQKLT